MSSLSGLAVCEGARIVEAVRRLPWPTRRAFARISLQLAVIEAAREVRIEPVLLLAISLMESGLDEGARNPASTATGPFQFTEQSWLASLHRYGPRYGQGLPAGSVWQLPGGAYAASAPVYAFLMSRRGEPMLAARMAAAGLASDRAVLQAATRHPPTALETYLVHMLGEPCAARFVAAMAMDPQTPSDEVAPEAVAANPGVFIRDGVVLSVSDAAELLSERLGAQLTVATRMVAAVTPVAVPAARPLPWRPAPGRGPWRRPGWRTATAALPPR